MQRQLTFDPRAIPCAAVFICDESHDSESLYPHSMGSRFVLSTLSVLGGALIACPIA